MDNLKEIIKKDIILKFGSITAAAKLLNISDAAFHKNLDRLSEKFLRRLESIGVNIPRDRNISNSNYIGTQYGGENTIKTVVNEHRFPFYSSNEYHQLEEKVKSLQNEVETLKNNLRDKERIIELLEMQLKAKQ